MTPTEREAYRQTPQWLTIDSEVKLRTRGHCLDCLWEGRVRKAQDTHHLIPELYGCERDARLIDGELVDNMLSLIPLCRDCHVARHPEWARELRRRHA